ncbi:hypothetical protein [Streptomyces sp. NPDC047108]|uniref:SCO4225 family membrane protein n=1 Tax=Streptomyces sp. NPDC047108 TaxID=3155025 RepID=UPI0033F2E7F4
MYAMLITAPIGLLLTPVLPDGSMAAYWSAVVLGAVANAVVISHLVPRRPRTPPRTPT